MASDVGDPAASEGPGAPETFPETVPAQPLRDVTLREVLALAPVRRGVPEVVAGAGQLDRSIRWVHSGELSTMSELLQGGELLLMTGIGLGESSEEQRRFIRTLTRRGIAALVLELGERFNAPPKPMVVEAQRAGLPFVVLHRRVPFVEIAETALREILERQMAFSRQSDELHARLTGLLIADGGVADLIDEIARSLAATVFLEKAGEGPSFRSSVVLEDSDVEATWSAFVRGLLPPENAYAVDVVGPGGRRWGRVVVTGVGSMSSFTRSVIEHAVPFVSVALARGHAEEALRVRERADFIAKLLDQAAPEEVLAGRAVNLGLRSPSLLPIALGLARDHRRVSDWDHRWSIAFSRFREVLTQQRIAFLASTRSDEGQMLLIVGLPSPSKREAVALTIRSLIDAVTLEFGSGDGVKVIMTLGESVDSWRAARDGLRLAQRSLAVAALTARHPWYDAQIPTTEGLVWALREEPVLARFVHDRLGALIALDARRPNARLLPTLETLCTNGGRRTDTARELFIERQTLYHRIARIEKALSVDLSDATTLLDLHLALSIERILGPTHTVKGRDVTSNESPREVAR